MITIHTPTSVLNKSIAFYSNLKYELVNSTNPCLFKDGKTFIEINPDRYTRPGLKFYEKSWKQEVENLEQLTVVHVLSNGYLLNDSNGCWLYLIEQEFAYNYESKEKKGAITGNFAGVSLESSDVSTAMALWRVLGFSKKMGDPNGEYVVLENSDGFNVSIMKPLTCPHLFFNPSMTYFNGKDNLKIIEEIRKANISITEEITHFSNEGVVDNIITRDPGLRLFYFQ